MRIRAQIGMVLNLDKCLGCHTCSVTCKQVWSNRKGVEYAWFNNVETKPGIGYPAQWENQQIWKGGWEVGKKDRRLRLRIGRKWRILTEIFCNPTQPQMLDYYTPFDFDYGTLQGKEKTKSVPSARPYSVITGKTMPEVSAGPNWEDSLAGSFESRARDVNLEGVEKDICGQYEHSFMAFLPRLCEHCLNPACVAACPSGAVYKREEDGIVLIDQEKCRGWRMCISGCPYKKIYYNWNSGKSEKCIFCYPRIEAGQPTVCSETCVGRIRYLGVLLYDADKISDAASVSSGGGAYEAQLGIFLNPHDPEIIQQAREDGIDENWLIAAQKSPVYRMIKEWKIAFPLHPEYRTLPMVWYVPPLSPITEAADSGFLESIEGIPDIKSLRIPMRYLANLLTAGDEIPIEKALKTLLALRAYMRRLHVENKKDEDILKSIGLTEEQMERLYKLLAIADYGDRFAVPPAHKEENTEAYIERGLVGFHFNQMAGEGASRFRLWGGHSQESKPVIRRKKAADCRDENT